ncbi:MAG: hypothetical protein QOJ65_317 [Fimbriimonadaceae bacterium]|jgi:hypothetical protein|nr:hypothetical protein [Fimbriimonadaceae bacterium]
MFDFWKDELTPEEEDALLDKLAGEVKKRKLQTPAAMFLELHKPLANVGGHFALATSPFLVPFLGYKNVDDYSRLLSKRENVEKLIQRLESDSDLKNDAKEAPC